VAKLDHNASLLSRNLHEGTEENKQSHDTIAVVLVRNENGQHVNTNLKALQARSSVYASEQKLKSSTNL